MNPVRRRAEIDLRFFAGRIQRNVGRKFRGENGRYFSIFLIIVSHRRLYKGRMYETAIVRNVGEGESTMVDGPGILARRANFSRIKDAKLSYRFLSPPGAHILANRVLELPGRVLSAKINLRAAFRSLGT